jgi:acyl-CoA thioester hydrolase
MKNSSGDLQNKARFQVKIEVTPEDIDELGHVNNVVYLQWVQQVASAHWQTLASSSIKQNYLWVVLRHEIDYLNPAFLGDEVLGYSWVSLIDGAKSLRHVTLYAGEKCLAEAKTNWCLLDARTLKPRRIGPDIKALFEA